ncbi:SMR family transporter, partial [Escherichia coli]
MKGWLFLVIAIVGEVIATSALKSSEGFTGNDSNLLIVFYV